MQATRTETDLLGTFEVPADACYGIHTARALANFPNTGHRRRRIGDYPALLHSLIQCKQAAAQVNGRIGCIDPAVASAIEQAGRQVIEKQMHEQFPVHALHGGGGTSANMNINEVLANLAEETLGGQRGRYELVHPNDHVNRNQSTNDVYPTACHLAILTSWDALSPRFERLGRALEQRVVRFGDTPHLARTCLQDALATTFGDFFGGHIAMLRRRHSALHQAITPLHELTLGGTAVGRRRDVPDAYFDTVIPALRALTGRDALTRPDDLFDAYQNIDAMVQCTAELETLARCLIKLAHDLRLLASGPDAGLGELTLPPVQAGSSMMPGKVNPVIPEFVMQSCFAVVGHATAAKMTVDHGELDLNVWESTAVTSILDSMELLGDALTTFTDNCVSQLEPVAARNEQNATVTIPALTDLTKAHGYAKVSALWKITQGDHDARLREVKRRLGESDAERSN